MNGARPVLHGRRCTAKNLIHHVQWEGTVFEPENSLEALMQAAGKDPSVVPAFYQALLETEIYVLTPETPMKLGRRRSLKFRLRTSEKISPVGQAATAVPRNTTRPATSPAAPIRRS